MGGLRYKNYDYMMDNEFTHTLIFNPNHRIKSSQFLFAMSSNSNIRFLSNNNSYLMSDK